MRVRGREEQREREPQADFPWSTDPDKGLDLMNLRSDLNRNQDLDA